MKDELFLILLGASAGFTGGLLGIGGSLVMIPALVLYGGADRQHLYQATAMIVNFFVVAPAVRRHWRARAFTLTTIYWMVPLAIIGSVGGVLVSELPAFRGPGQGWLQVAFAAFLLYVFVANLRRLRQERMAAQPDDSSFDHTKQATNPGLAATIGLGTGLAGGLLGIGGGLVAVPLQQAFLKLPLRNCIANSAATILFSSVLAAGLKNWQLPTHGFERSEAWMMAAYLIPPAVIASWFGASRTHHWPLRSIRLAFSIVVGYAAIRLATIGWATAAM